MLQNADVFNILTCKCASRHSGVQFFDIKPPKSGPYPSVFSTFWLTNMLRATAACHFWTSELPKWLRQCGVLCILTCKCASRHSRVAFWNIGTSKMAPPMWCFVHFDLQMCFAPQPRGILDHRNFQNGSANVVFCAFWLANVLRATAACHFSPVCPNSYLRTRRFSEPTFPTSGTTTHCKNTAIRDVPNIFSRMYLLSSDSTRVLIFFRLTWHLYSARHLYSAFQLCILSEVRLLNFLRLFLTSSIYLVLSISIHIPLYIYPSVYLPVYLYHRPSTFYYLSPSFIIHRHLSSFIAA